MYLYLSCESYFLASLDKISVTKQCQIVCSFCLRKVNICSGMLCDHDLMSYHLDQGERGFFIEVLIHLLLMSTTCILRI